MRYLALVTRAILLLVTGVAAGLLISSTGVPGLLTSSSKLHAQVRGLQTQAERIKAENNYLGLVSANQQKYSSRIKTLREKLAKIQVVAPDTADPDAFTQRIAKLAQAKGVHLLSFTPMERLRHDYYSEMPFSVKIEAPYVALALYLNALSNQTRRLRIENVKLEVPAGDGSRGIKSNQPVIATCVVYTYFGLGSAGGQD